MVDSEARPIDLVDLAHRCGVHIGDADGDGFAGLLMHFGTEWGILLRKTDSPRRRRFTLAHELGHFCMPAHHRRAISCASPETNRSVSGRETEQEANDFAAELLMPRKIIVPLLKAGAIDLKRSNELSEVFDVSQVSAALRLSELTKEPTAIVYLEHGMIKWFVRQGFPYGIDAVGEKPPIGTVAHDIANGGVGSVAGQEVDPALWLPGARSTPSVVIESSLALGEDNGILSMLWAPDYN